MPQNFSVPAADMLQDGRTMQALFLDDKAEFIALDDQFDDPFAADWLESIDTSDGVETAETREDEQMQKTEDVLLQIDEVVKVHTVSKYFVEKAFAGKKGLQNKFGLDDFATEGRTQRAISSFLENLYKQCQSADYKPALLAAGMTQAQIDEIETVRQAFNDLNTDQDKFIRTTTQATADRDKQYNSTYDFAQRVNRASKVIFRGNIIKLNQYALPHGSSGEDFNVEGKVTDGSNGGATLKGVLVEIKELGVTTYTNFYGNFGFVDIPAGSYTLSFTLPGYGPKTVPFTLVANGKQVINQSMTVL